METAFRSSQSSAHFSVGIRPARLSEMAPAASSVAKLSRAATSPGFMGNATPVAATTPRPMGNSRGL